MEFEMQNMRAMLGGAAIAFALIAAQCSAHAAVADRQANGFRLEEKEQIAAPPDKVYAALIDIGKWWSYAHTFSGDPKNMTLDARAGGCWCETLPKTGGTVQHMTVIYTDPGKVLRLRGALGPMQATALEGVMTIVLTPSNGGTAVQLVYNVGGYVVDGYQSLPETADGVLGLQLFRLKQLLETGSADTPRPPETKK
jgi:uncharacterized protein YndB with AHSA1/START domain